MSKNIIQYSSHLISIFKDLGLAQGKNEIFIKPPEDSSEFDLFKRFKIQELENVIHNIKTAKFSNNIVAITNLNDMIDDNTIATLESFGIEKIEPNGAYFISIVKDLGLGISKRSSMQEIEEKILFQQEDISSYNGHNWKDLEEYIEPYMIFEIVADSLLFEEELSTISYFIYSHINTAIHLNITDLMSSYRALLLIKSPIPKENIFLSFTSSHWKHAYLELYRCIEKLYHIPRALELKRTIGYNGSAEKLARTCRDQLRWKRKEEDSLILLIQAINEKYLISCNIFNSPALNLKEDEHTTEIIDPITSVAIKTMIDPEKSKKSIGEKIYTIRNELVHQIEDSTNNYTENDWTTLINLLLIICEDRYSAYSTELLI